MNDLLDCLIDLGAPFELSAPDEILCCDLDLLPNVKPRHRLGRLRAAKREVLRRYLDDCVDPIREEAENDGGDPTMLLGGFIAEDFVGRNNQATPSSHATLAQNFYGRPLSARAIRTWTKIARAAARPPSVSDRVGARPIVYFISTDNPATVKIGFSANFKHRLRSLRTASPVEPRVHLTIDGDKRLEDELHERFRADHIRREWFRLSGEVAAFIGRQK
jgi:hypothetical protein